MDSREWRSGSSGRWTIIATHVGAGVVRADPFADIDLELAALWADSSEA